MIRRFSIIALALLACACSKSDNTDEPENPGNEGQETVVPRDKVLENQVMASSVIGTPMTYSIYLPYNYDPATPTPVLYLLHGAGGDNTDWVRQGDFDKRMSEAKSEFAVVMPNGSPGGKDLFYIDNYQNLNYQYMTYFFGELVPGIEKKYNLGGSRERRAVAGLSMGGYGSLYYGSLHPEMFCCVYACSPATSITGTPNIMSLWLSVQKKDASLLPDLTIEIGTSDFLYASANSFRDFLLKYEIPHEYITREGAHDWPFWQVCAPKIIKRCTEILKK